MLRKKSERGVSDISLVCAGDVFGGVSFEKAEKSAQAVLKKGAEAEFVVDISARASCTSSLSPKG